MPLKTPHTQTSPQLNSESLELVRQLAYRTAYSIGDEFFQEVVTTLAGSLGVSQVLLTECLESPPTRLRTLAFCSKDELQENFEYDLAGTPCEQVVSTGSYFCPSGVQASFPSDQDLVDLNTEGYGGVSLLDSLGEVVGHLCYLSEDKLDESFWDLPALEIIRARCGAEIERTKIERIRNEEAKVLEESKRLAALGTLAAGIAHEINNPLTTIRLSAEMALMEVDKDKEGITENLNSVIRSADSISQIVDSVLRSSSNQDTAKSKCNLGDIVARAIELTSHMTEDLGTSVDFKNSGKFEVFGNALEIQQVFVNLISNAIQATQCSTHPVGVSIETKDKNIVVQISNHGDKIPPSELERIFEPFYTTRNSKGGTGLGLSVSRGIVRNHNGEIDVSSSSEQTSFRVIFPKMDV